MSLDYSYWNKLPLEEQKRIDKEVAKNRLELKWVACFPFFQVPMPMPRVPFFPVEGFRGQQIVRNARDRAESAVEERLRPLCQAIEEGEEIINEAKEIKKSLDEADKIGKEWEKLSKEEKYDRIRASKTDVEAIAKNTGYKAENVKKCKNHIFYNVHKLDRYEVLGEPAEIRRFDADEDQAEAWKRLEQGTHTEEDLTWLKHEKAEEFYEKEQDAGYSESHEKAERHWPGYPWSNEEDE